MANIDITCPNCGSNQAFIRNSQKINNTIKVELYCKNCCACSYCVMAEIVEVRLANYENTELRNFVPMEDWAKKKAQEKNTLVDERQLQIPTD